MLIENCFRPRTLLFAICIGAAAGACSIETDDIEDGVGDDDDGDDDDDVDVDVCTEDCDSAKVDCEGDCDDEDDACVGSCQVDFDDCTNEC